MVELLENYDEIIVSYNQSITETIDQIPSHTNSHKYIKYFYEKENHKVILRIETHDSEIDFQDDNLKNNLFDEKIENWYYPKNYKELLKEANNPIPTYFSNVILLDKNDKILLIKRAKTNTFPGCWLFAGGKIESQEDPKEAGKRELYEEVGIDLTISEFKPKFLVEMARPSSTSKTTKFLTMFFFTAKVDLDYKDINVVLCKREADDYKWID